MQVISVMNYKGGVGKTTISANLGAAIANRGYRVLLIDLDPQTNLTFSFYSVDDWHEDLREDRTIKRWYETDIPGQGVKLVDLVMTPDRVNASIPHASGRLDLISSDLGLIDIDLQLAAQLGGTTLQDSKRRYLRLHSCLAESLSDAAFAGYDVALIDCAPNFGLVTKTAIVASDHVLIPAKADYLSTLGIGYLIGSCDRLVAEYNDYVAHGAEGAGKHRKIEPRFLGVVFNMVQMYANKPISSQQTYINEVRVNSQVPVLSSTVRNSARYFGSSGSAGIPAILQAGPEDEVAAEFERLTDEVVGLAAIGGGR